ncbi:MAG: signal peptidase I [Enterobacteriaceae bacterium]
MANTFVWILFIATVVTGLLWCLDRFFLAPARRRKVAEAEARSAQPIEAEALAKISKAPGWLETGVSIFPVLALVFVIRSFIYEPFQIPSGSMMPTLLIGDFILVEKFAYGIKNPLTQETLIATGHPKRGDIAVFKYPLSPQVDYIKRVIGLPGDRVIYDPIKKQLTVYPRCADNSNCNSVPLSYSTTTPSLFVQTPPILSQSGGFYQVPVSDSSVEGVRLDQTEEHLDKNSHEILTNPLANTGFGYRQAGEMPGVFVVPDGEYFMMGDNRDNSADSRFWGFVPEKNLVGRAVAIWMSFEKQEGEWPTGVRLQRIGSIH